MVRYVRDVEAGGSNPLTPTRFSSALNFRTGQRAVTTWRDRIRRLEELGFIATAPGPSGDISFAVIYNPYLVLKEHHAKKTPGLTPRAYTSLKHRAVEVGESELL